MTIVYDLKNESVEWCQHVNATISKECPEYFSEHCIIGSNEWWKLYESNKIVKEIQRGNIVFVGERTDLLDHLMNIVEIDCNGELIELEICENWECSYLVVGVLLEIESFSVNFMGRYGPYKFLFEKRIEIVST
jgi:hypothetical protein